MIRPIGVQHADLCHRRVPVLFLAEIILNMKKILKGHGKPQRAIQFH